MPVQVMPRISQQNLISVCICTFKRPELLRRALEGITAQIVPAEHTVKVIVVDNDHRRSAEAVVKQFQKNLDWEIEYDCEPEQNIALARNKAVEKAKGNLVAFIDDDEFPEPTWLFNLFDTYRRYSADGVLGPVIPFYAGEPPLWLIKSEICVRSSFPTGTILRNSRNMRTGNLLLDRHLLDGDDIPFNPRFGRTGGEDTDFFERMLERGRNFVWCNEAPVYEEVPIERQKKSYFIKRALVRGFNRADMEQVISVGTIKSIVALFTYTLCLPVLFAVSHHNFIKFLISYCDHLSKLLGHCGLKLFRERNF